LTAVGRQKSIIFPAVGLLLVFNYWFAIVRPRRMQCEPGDICHVDSHASRLNRAMFWSSLAIYVAAVAITYGAQWWILHS
jgi:hypothetical protein